MSAPAKVTQALLARVDAKRAARRRARTVELPAIGSFRQFLREHARVKVGSGYAPYTFAGREPLEEIVDVIDRILGGDESVSLAGGGRQSSAAAAEGTVKGRIAETRPEENHVSQGPDLAEIADPATVDWRPGDGNPSAPQEEEWRPGQGGDSSAAGASPGQIRGFLDRSAAVPAAVSGVSPETSAGAGQDARRSTRDACAPVATASPTHQDGAKPESPVAAADPSGEDAETPDPALDDRPGTEGGGPPPPPQTGKWFAAEQELRPPLAWHHPGPVAAGPCGRQQPSGGQGDAALNFAQSDFGRDPVAAGPCGRQQPSGGQRDAALSSADGHTKIQGLVAATEPSGATFTAAQPPPIPDATLAICGGAQFGKTVLMLNLLAYLVAVRFRNLGYYLPDDDLVAGVVDGKLRPDVLDQIPWLARLLEVGRTLSPTGRAVHRKGAMMCTDGRRTALAWMRGLGKIPTSFSMDAVIQDEKDDLPEARAKFLAGRMTASDLRFSLVIGTQRYHGAGQNREFEHGSQHVGLLRPNSCGAFRASGCPTCRGGINPEEHWPSVCRLAVTGTPRSDDPKLTLEGRFELSCGPVAAGDLSGGNAETPDPGVDDRPGTEGGGPPPPPQTGKRPAAEQELRPPLAWHHPVPVAAGASPRQTRGSVDRSAAVPAAVSGVSPETSAGSGQDARRAAPRYYLACPDCGAELDRAGVRFEPRRPGRIAARRWSFRVSQLIIPAIGLGQIVRAYREAVADPEKMIAFCTDRLALPKSVRQQLTPAILERARRTAPYAYRARLSEVPPAPPGAARFAGLDTGDRCWLVVTEQPPGAGPTRVIWAEEISAERTRARAVEVVAALGVQTLLVDAGPLRDLARDVVMTLSGLAADSAPAFLRDDDFIEFGRGGLVWDGPHASWRGLRAAAVEFTQRAGAGLRHKLARTQDGLVYPLLAANRGESIQRVVNDLLTAEEGVIDVRTPGAAARTEPALLLPCKCASSRERTTPFAVGDNGGDQVSATGGGRSFRSATHSRSISGGGKIGAGARSAGQDARRGTRDARAPDFKAPSNYAQDEEYPSEPDATILATLDEHLLTGSRREPSRDGRSLRFVGRCENHLLLALAYAKLAERLAASESALAAALAPSPGGFHPLGGKTATILARRQDRRADG
ncbi:MAG: hypothetical protein AAGK14_01655 [Verrucomicrobiota bacterium]